MKRGLISEGLYCEGGLLEVKLEFQAVIGRILCPRRGVILSRDIEPSLLLLSTSEIEDHVGSYSPFSL